MCMCAETTLHGNTLRVYLYLLKEKKPLGVREIMRALGFSTPSLVHYHLNKLLNAGYIEQEGSKYIVKKQVKIGLMKYLVIVAGKMLPRFALYTGLFFALLVFHIIFVLENLLLISIYFSVFIAVLAFIVMLIETISFWNELSPYLAQKEK